MQGLILTVQRARCMACLLFKSLAVEMLIKRRLLEAVEMGQVDVPGRKTAD